MPEDESRNDASKEPDSNASIQPPRQPPGNQNPPAPPPDNNSRNNQSTIAELEQDIRGGERWLIGIGIATILVNIGIGLVYWGQLIQMRASVQKMDDAISAASRSALAAENANTQSKDQFLEDQRPYVWQAPGLGPSMGQNGNSGFLPATPGQNALKCGTFYQNYGRSPAIIGMVTGDVEIGANATARFKNRGWISNQSVLPPGKADLLTFPGETMTSQNAPIFENEGAACYFRIQYRDETGHLYETDLCFHGLHTASTILSYCPPALHLNRMIDCEKERCERAQ